MVVQLALMYISCILRSSPPTLYGVFCTHIVQVDTYVGIKYVSVHTLYSIYSLRLSSVVV